MQEFEEKSIIVEQHADLPVKNAKPAFHKNIFQKLAILFHPDKKNIENISASPQFDAHSVFEVKPEIFIEQDDGGPSSEVYWFFDTNARDRIESFINSNASKSNAENEVLERSESKIKSIEELWNEGSLELVIEFLYYDYYDDDTLLSYIERIGTELISNESFTLSSGHQDLLAQILIRTNSPESIKILENLLLWIRLSSDNLLSSNRLFNSAIFCILTEHKRTGDSLNDWLGDFFYSYLLMHPSAFEKYTAGSPLGAFLANEIIIEHIISKIFEDADVFQAKKENEHTQQLINEFIARLTRECRRYLHKILKLPDIIIGIFQRNQHIPIDQLISILSIFSSDFMENANIDEYISFVTNQFDSVEDITESSLEANTVNNKVNLFSKHNKAMNFLTSQSRNGESLNNRAKRMVTEEFPPFSRGAGMLCDGGRNQDVFEDVLSVYSLLDQSEKIKERTIFLEAFVGERLSVIAQHVDDETLREIFSFKAREPMIRAQLNLSINKLTLVIIELFDDQDPLSLLTILDFLSSQETIAAVDSWLTNPNIIASGINSPEKILIAIYNYWSASDVNEINSALSLAFNLPDDEKIQWGNFDFKKKKAISDIVDIQDIATSGELTENAKSLYLYAQESKYDVSVLMNGLLSYKEFITHVKKGEVESLSSIRSIDIITHLEPKWFSIMIEVLQEKLSAKEGFADVLVAIETLVKRFENEKQIDGKDGLWRHRLVLNRDGSKVEDQTIYIVLRVENGKPQLNIEFKLTRDTVTSVMPKLANISEFKRWRPKRDTHDQRMHELEVKIKEIGNYCSNCNVFHSKGGFDNVTISEIEELGFTKEEYMALLEFNKQNKRITEEVVNVGIRYPSSPTAQSKLGSDDESIVAATAEFQPEPQTLVATVGPDSSLYGYHGAVDINLDMDQGGEPRQLALRLFGVLTMMGLDGVLAPVDDEARRKLSINRYLWHRRIEPQHLPNTNEVVGKLKWKEVFLGYHTFVEEGFHKELEREGLAFLYSTMRTVNGVVGAFDVGLLCANQRRHLGLIRGGWSTGRDMQTGGSDYAFVRAAVTSESTEGARLGWGGEKYIAVWDTDPLDRTDWFAQHSDKYGSTHGEDFATRADPLRFIQEEQRQPSSRNEVCFKKGIAADHLAFVVTQTKKDRADCIAALKQRGIHFHRGVPIEECVICGPTKIDPTRYYKDLQWLPKTKDVLLDKYAIMKRKYEARLEPRKKQGKKSKF